LPLREIYRLFEAFDKPVIGRVELRSNGLLVILSLVPLTPAAAPPNRLQGCVFTREFPMRIKLTGTE